MPDGNLIYRSDLERTKGQIVRIPVRDCPDGRVAAAGLTGAFREFNENAHVVWENRR